MATPSKKQVNLFSVIDSSITCILKLGDTSGIYTYCPFDLDDKLAWVQVCNIDA